MSLSRLLALLSLALLVAACENVAPSAPSVGPLDGTWSGTIVNQTPGNGELTLTMTQAALDRPVTGTWRARFPAEPTDRGGIVSGSTIGSRVTLALVLDSSLPCASGGVATPTMGVSGEVTGDRMTGSYALFACGAVETGTIDVTRAR